MTNPPTERLSWTFDRNIPNPEMRKAHALEHIAYYLDRIEAHLEKIAATSEKSQINLSAIAHVIPKIASGVNQ
jgi:hypothetical protein